MKVVTHLSTHVAANEVCQRQGEDSSTSSSPTSLPTRRARHQGAPAPHPDVPEGVCRSLAERMSQVTTYTGATTEGDTSDHEKQLGPRWRKHLKSAMVLNKVTWPHEVAYTLAGKPAAYQDILTHLFIQGYFIVMDTEEELIRKKMITHLKDLMSNAQLCGWDRARTFHFWRNQLEQGHCTWLGKEEKLKVLLRHPASSSPSAQPHYTDHQHICSFCLLSINCAFPHPKKDCIRKEHST